MEEVEYTPVHRDSGVRSVLMLVNHDSRVYRFKNRNTSPSELALPVSLNVLVWDRTNCLVEFVPHRSWFFLVSKLMTRMGNWFFIGSNDLWISFLLLQSCGAWWLIGRFGAFRPKGWVFESRSGRHVGTLVKYFTHSCLWRFGMKLRHSICAVSIVPLSRPSSGLEEAL